MQVECSAKWPEWCSSQEFLWVQKIPMKIWSKLFEPIVLGNACKQAHSGQCANGTKEMFQRNLNKKAQIRKSPNGW